MSEERKVVPLVRARPDESFDETLERFDARVEERNRVRKRLRWLKSDLVLMKSSRRMMVRSFERNGPLALSTWSDRPLVISACGPELVEEPSERRRWIEKLLRIERRIGRDTLEVKELKARLSFLDAEAEAEVDKALSELRSSSR